MLACTWRGALWRRYAGCDPRLRRRVVCFSTPQVSDQDLYCIIGVPSSASSTEIKAAYRKLVHDLHPDKHAHKQGQEAAADAFMRCKMAYEVLSDDEQRKQYDAQLAAATQAEGVQAPPDTHPWNPYNSWMDVYTIPNGSTNQHHASAPQASAGGMRGRDSSQDYQEAAAATAAASANSSGLSTDTDPMAASLSSTGNEAHDSVIAPQRASAAVRSALLEQHGLMLEQFGSLQEALAALEEQQQQQAMVGLAEADYDTTWQL